jgi:hypothetical protein
MRFLNDDRGCEGAIGRRGMRMQVNEERRSGATDRGHAA